MAEHDDTLIFEALPGAGTNLSARLLATFGDDRSRFPTPESVQRLTGIAPVTKQSGNKRYVHRRFTKRTCPHFEHQTFIEWVSQTILKPGWRLLEATEGEENRTLGDHARPGLQVDPHPPPMLDRSRPLRRIEVRRRTQALREPRGRTCSQSSVTPNRDTRTKAALLLLFRLTFVLRDLFG